MNQQHDQFESWWNQQPESRDREARKVAWRAWKASQRQTLANLQE